MEKKTTDRELGSNYWCGSRTTKESHRDTGSTISTDINWNKFCYALCCTSPWLLIILLGVISLLIVALCTASYSKNSLAFQGDTLYLASASGFWYSGCSVDEIVQHGDYNHKLQFYTVPCESIQMHFFRGHFKSRQLYPTYETRMLGLVDYLYLLPGSNLTYSICLWTNQTLSTTSANFLAFDSLSAYQNFIDGLADGRDTSIMQQQLKIGSAKNPACSTINFIANKSAYYFMSADCPGGVTTQYNITSNVKYLNFTDYEDFPSCSVTEDESCQLVTDQSFFGAWEDVCLIAHVTLSLPYSTEPPTTHIKLEIVKRYQLLVIPAVLIIIGILGMLSMLLIVKFCKATQRKGYQPIA